MAEVFIGWLISDDLDEWDLRSPHLYRMRVSAESRARVGQFVGKLSLVSAWREHPGDLVKMVHTVDEIQAK